MNRLLLVLGLAATFCLGACAPRAVRPSPKLGRLEDIHTKAGTYDGYSVQMHFEHTATLQGHRGGVVLTGHGRRAIHVLPGGRNVDSLAPPGTPNLRIDFPIMRGPEEVPRPGFRAGRIEGLDDDFLREQGWLFQDCGPGYSEFCEPSGAGFITPSFKSVDPLIAYLGKWLKEGDYAGTLSISVWQHMGVPEDIRTPFGQHEGYTVDWCSSLDKGSRRLIVLTGQGSRVFRPMLPDQPEDIEKRGNSAVAIGSRGSEGIAFISRPGCNAPYAAWTDVVSYEEVDAAIAEWGRRIQEDDAKGELVIRVSGPFLLTEL
ncbi:hypothetical protein [Pyxidicoccus sp. MSG2]|uniref:hypothetical protein n=1 Tax=Pyxidicoccus sp. MSG2 TaxID=2996790 RepID=UPI002270A894|nr:hypothetical protein [Pyxidicoccus sp. MSG2]MCY1023909.1 hypothetical protein [Pyxidicoccus sp. MSG2]